MMNLTVLLTFVMTPNF